VDTRKLQVQYHLKFANPLFTLIMAMIAVPFGFLVHIWNVGRPDLGWKGIARVAFWPPDWWGMWWPQTGKARMSDSCGGNCGRVCRSI